MAELKDVFKEEIERRGKEKIFNSIAPILSNQERLLLKSNKWITIDYKRIEEIIMAAMSDADVCELLKANKAYTIGRMREKIRNLHQVVIAAEANVSRTTAWRYKVGRSEVPLDVIEKLAKADLI